MDIYTKLGALTDKRTASGKRHSIEFCVICAIMAIMSGYDGFRAYADFVKRHKEALIKAFDIDKDRVPSNSTIRRVLQAVDPNELAEILLNKASEGTKIIAIDAKVSRSTVIKYDKNEQNFSLVASAFLHEHGIVIAQKTYTNKEGSEIEIVYGLIEKLALTGVIYTMDALHSQKNVKQD